MQAWCRAEEGGAPAEQLPAGVTEAPLVSEQNGPFTSRELYFQQQEEAGAFTFTYLYNDGQLQHCLW